MSATASISSDGRSTLRRPRTRDREPSGARKSTSRPAGVARCRTFRRQEVEGSVRAAANVPGRKAGSPGRNSDCSSPGRMPVSRATARATVGARRGSTPSECRSAGSASLSVPAAWLRCRRPSSVRANRVARVSFRPAWSQCRRFSWARANRIALVPCATAFRSRPRGSERTLNTWGDRQEELSAPCRRLVALAAIDGGAPRRTFRPAGRRPPAASRLRSKAGHRSRRTAAAVTRNSPRCWGLRDVSVSGRGLDGPVTRPATRPPPSRDATEIPVCSSPEFLMRRGEVSERAGRFGSPRGAVPSRPAAPAAAGVRGRT